MRETVTLTRIKINFLTGWDGGIAPKIVAGCEIVKKPMLDPRQWQVKITVMSKW